MVSVAYFRADAENLLYEIERRCNDLQENASYSFAVARSTQKIFRGYITRKHKEKLDQKATCIQKNWRAFTGRSLYEKLLEEKFDQMCKLHYHSAAVTMQKHWKGHWVRSRIFSHYKLKSWLEYVTTQNVNLKCLSQRYRAAQNKVEVERREEESKQWILYILFKLHHLLRTRQISGIYSLPKTSSLSDIEKMLKGLKYKDFMKFYNSYKEDVRKKKSKEMPTYILQNCKYASHFEKEWHSHKLLHKESYVESSFPKDRYTRYELSEEVSKIDQIEFTPVLCLCSCSFCTENKKE